MSTQDKELADLDKTMQVRGHTIRRCPLCDRTGADVDEIYRHLLVNHRKSELIQELLALLDTKQTGGYDSDEEPELLSGDSLI